MMRGQSPFPQIFFPRTATAKYSSIGLKSGGPCTFGVFGPPLPESEGVRNPTGSPTLPRNQHTFLVSEIWCKKYVQPETCTKSCNQKKTTVLAQDTRSRNLRQFLLSRTRLLSVCNPHIIKDNYRFSQRPETKQGIEGKIDRFRPGRVRVRDRVRIR